MAPLSEVRDAFQQRLLTCLYRGPASSSLVLKGGAAMRVLTASARYTQDLDFDHDPRRSLTSLQTTVRSAIARALQGSGLTQTSISEPKQTDTVARWKISGRTSTGEESRSHLRSPLFHHATRYCSPELPASAARSWPPTLDRCAQTVERTPPPPGTEALRSWHRLRVGSDGSDCRSCSPLFSVVFQPICNIGQ